MIVEATHKTAKETLETEKKQKEENIKKLSLSEKQKVIF